MKILTVTHFFESHRGGIEIVAGRLARELGALGHNVSWAASGVDAAPGDRSIASIPLKTINFIERLSGLPMPIPRPSAIRRLWSATRSADAVIVHDGLYATSVTALLASKLAGKPVILVQHIGEIPFANPILARLMRIANRLITRPMLRAADQVCFISETTARYFRTVAFKREPVLAFNGVDTDVFRPAADGERERLRRTFAFSPNEPVVLFVGRFVEKKGLSILRHIAAARPGVQFALAGWGPIEPDNWGLSNIRTFGGLAGADLASLYRASDAFLIPSAGEGFPLVIQEALACDLPTLCGSESAAADPAAAPMLHGLPVDLGRPAETARIFVDALSDALDEPRDGRRSELARSRYSWRTTALRYDAILTALNESTPVPGPRPVTNGAR